MLRQQTLREVRVASGSARSWRRPAAIAALIAVVAVLLALLAVGEYLTRGSCQTRHMWTCTGYAPAAYEAKITAFLAQHLRPAR